MQHRKENHQSIQCLPVAMLPIKKQNLALCATLLIISACSSKDNDNAEMAGTAGTLIDQILFFGTTEEQTNNCNAIAATAPTQTNVKYVGNIWREEVDSDEEFTHLWNQITAENAGKWGEVESTQDIMEWNRLDAAFNYAANNAMPYKHHTLVWGANQPSWLAALSTEQQRAETEQWIELVAMRYPTAAQVDVVNEPLHVEPVYIAALEQMGSTSPSSWTWVINTFAKARQSFPNSELLLNDFNILNSDTNTSEYLEIISTLQADNLIDGIGVQAHFLENKSDETIRLNLDRLGATGLPVYISEFDLNIENDQEQLTRMQQLFPIFYTSAHVNGITFWGFRENQIWRANSHLIDANGVKRPALKWLECYLQQ